MDDDAIFPVLSGEIIYWKIRFPRNFKYYPTLAGGPPENKNLFAGGPPANKKLFAGGLPANKTLFARALLIKLNSFKGSSSFLGSSSFVKSVS